MQIIPAIDIYQNQCVRLTQGSFAHRTDYGILPVDVARRFLEEGARYLHVVDLEGAKEGRVINWKAIEEVAALAGGRMQLGGGIRTDTEVKRLFAHGINRIVLGSVALQQPDLLERWIAEYGAQRICVALDINDGKIAYSGWQVTGEQTIQNAATRLLGQGIRTFLSTDIARDGRMAGPNVSLYRSLVQEYPQAEWIASGGVRSRNDIEALRGTGVSGVIIGKALYEGSLTLRDCMGE